MSDPEADRRAAPDTTAATARKPGAVPALAAICFAMSLNQNVFAALNPFLGREFGFSDDQLGALILTALETPGLVSALAPKDERFFVAKAAGWALRQYARHAPEWVRTWVGDHEARLPALTRREALKHLR